MREPLECFIDVAFHTDVHAFIGAVPLQIESTIVAPFPIFCDCVMLAQCIAQMFGGGSVSEFDSKIIHDEAKRDSVQFVSEQSVCAFGGMTSGGFEAWEEEIRCDAAGLGQAVHALRHLNVDESFVVDYFLEVTLLDDGLRDERQV